MSSTTTLRHRKSISSRIRDVNTDAISGPVRWLYRYDELPEWQQDNDKIYTGYIRETRSVKACFRSLLLFNNETINILTHFVPTLTYLVLLVGLADMYLIPSFPTATTAQYVMIYFFLFGAVVCLGCSSFFHTLKQHSEVHSVVWSKIDYMGIIIMITCSMISLLYYGYHDCMYMFQCFAAFTLALGSVCAVVALHNKFNSKTFRPFRAMLYVSFGFSGVVPILTGLWMYGMYETSRRIQLRYVLLEGLFYILGALVYGSRFPEVFLPGKFDFVGHSHQIFHVMVILGSLCHLRAIVGSYVFINSGLHNPGLIFIR